MRVVLIPTTPLSLEVFVDAVRDVFFYTLKLIIDIYLSHGLDTKSQNKQKRERKEEEEKGVDLNRPA